MKVLIRHGKKKYYFFPLIYKSIIFGTLIIYIVIYFQLILPVFFVCLCMWITYKLPPLEQPRAIYADHTICPECLAGFMNVENNSGSWTEKYIEELLKPAGFGSKCVRKNQTK